jgi:hypothetical protein
LLKRLQDITEFEWISTARWQLGSRGDGGEGHTLRHLLPDTFAAYFKILHPLYQDVSIDDRSRAWAAGDKFRVSDLVRTTWKQVASEHGVPYHRLINPDAFTKAFGGTWPRYLLGPDEGTLDADLLKQLGHVMSKQTSSNRWYFEYFIVATADIESDELYVGDDSDLLTANEQAGCRAGPTYWWPDDRAWVVCSDYDLAFTVVAASQAAVQELARTHDFEGFQMHISDRIDHRSQEEQV